MIKLNMTVVETATLNHALASAAWHAVRKARQLKHYCSYVDVVNHAYRDLREDERWASETDAELRRIAEWTDKHCK